MWIVRLALRRPYTFVVASLLLVLVSTGVLQKTPTDVFPSVDIPIISVVWSYGGLPATQMERQITQFSEYTLSGNVPGIRTIDSQSFDGVAVIRVYLEDDADVSAAIAQVTASSQSITRRMPPGTQPPTIVRFSASSVPILQLAFSSSTVGEAELLEFVNQRVRTKLSAIPGVRLPLPMGGRFRQVAVDLDLEALASYGLSPSDVSAAVGAGNLTLPTGSAKLGEIEYRVALNSSPETIDALNDLPIRLRDGRVIFVRDVAHVHDGFAPQTSIARRDGGRAVVMSVLKTGDASALEIARRVRAELPALRAMGPGVEMEVLADQSEFVRRAIDGLLVEGLIAALLTAAMILLFLGSLRSTVVVLVSIPLSVLAALLVMRALGHTINTMTLGGLALAVGVLVDDATVEIENIHRNLAMGKPLTRAILDGAEQIAVPALVASLSIGLVFFSVLLLEGPSRYLFVPLGLAVGLSVMASYLLSRTLVPTLVKYLLAGEAEHGAPRSALGRVHARVSGGLDALRDAYGALLSRALARPRAVVVGSIVVAVAAGALSRVVGTEFFPTVDAGQLRLHVTAPAGTRIEETERWFASVERVVGEVVGADRELVLSQIGMPSGYTLAVTDTANVSVADGEVLVRLRRGRHRSTSAHAEALRARLTAEFPELGFYFQPADMVTQILNFGLPSPISVQVSGPRRKEALQLARDLERELRGVPGAADVRLHQLVAAPALRVVVDRTRAAEVGLSQRDVADDLLVALSGTGQVSPGYFTDPDTGNSISVVTQVPQRRFRVADDLTAITLNAPRGAQRLSDLATIERARVPVFASHTDVQPTYEVRADVRGLDLGRVARGVDAVLSKRPRVPGVDVRLQGQIESMRSSFSRLGLGLALAAALVYCLMVVNFQSWSAPAVVLSALPFAFTGVAAALFLTGTHLSVPALLGALMSVGVGTANATLLVAFAAERHQAGVPAADAALDAGRTRLRPILMTALAMGVGMLPMALGLSEGGEQNASLARAALGGLFGATAATLLVVPSVFAKVYARRAPRVVDPLLEEP